MSELTQKEQVDIEREFGRWIVQYSLENDIPIVTVASLIVERAQRLVKQREMAKNEVSG